MSTKNPTNFATLDLERLELRDNPSSYIYNYSLVVYDTSHATVDIVGTGYYAQYRVTEGSVATYHNANEVLNGAVKFYGTGNNDFFSNNTSLNTEAYGYGGNDTLYGGSGNDDLIGGSGHDDLRGRDGEDYLDGDSGNDILIGGEGRDLIYGESGDDRIWGDAGRDNLRGGLGNDDVYGGSGDDLLVGSLGNDRLYGNDGRDSLWGQQGNDILNGGDDGDEDHLVGGSGADLFQKDMQWAGIFLVNLDDPDDYDFWEFDSFYG